MELMIVWIAKRLASCPLAWSLIPSATTNNPNCCSGTPRQPCYALTIYRPGLCKSRPLAQCRPAHGPALRGMGEMAAGFQPAAILKSLYLIAHQVVHCLILPCPEPRTPGSRFEGNRCWPRSQSDVRGGRSRCGAGRRCDTRQRRQR